jgi:ribulose 1,5-bisphosphate synthetase/thiazole synthase
MSRAMPGQKGLAPMTAAPDIAIIGAGLYGLSLAAHLSAAGLEIESSASQCIPGGPERRKVGR